MDSEAHLGGRSAMMIGLDVTSDGIWIAFFLAEQSGLLVLDYDLFMIS